ncbi:hypothetical protein BJV78DRAFT_500548 [Lactifluus subvellereus]|nr:hypothetical protein BJV78DRAFT_500548 [Lactifluus subvellereus]
MIDNSRRTLSQRLYEAAQPVYIVRDLVLLRRSESVVLSLSLCQLVKTPTAPPTAPTAPAALRNPHALTPGTLFGDSCCHGSLSFCLCPVCPSSYSLFNVCMQSTSAALRSRPCWSVALSHANSDAAAVHALTSSSAAVEWISSRPDIAAIRSTPGSMSCSCARASAAESFPPSSLHHGGGRYLNHMLLRPSQWDFD